MSCVKLVWMFFPVFLCLLRSSSIKYPVSYFLVSSFLDPRVQYRDRIIHPKTNDGVHRRRSRPYPAGSLIRGVRRGIPRARRGDGAPRRGNPPFVSARGKLPAPYGSPRDHRIVLERGDLPVSGKLPVPSRNQPTSVSAGPAQLIFVSAGPAQLIFAGPVQLVFVSAGSRAPPSARFPSAAANPRFPSAALQCLLRDCALQCLLRDCALQCLLRDCVLQCLLRDCALQCRLLASLLQCRLLASLLQGRPRPAHQSPCRLRPAPQNPERRLLSTPLRRVSPRKFWGGLPTMEASQAPRSAMEASQAPCSAMAPEHPAPPWPPESPDPPWAPDPPWPPESPDPPWPPESPDPPWPPESPDPPWPPDPRIRPGGRLSGLQVLEASRAPSPPPLSMSYGAGHAIGRGGNVRLCLPLPLFPHPYMGLPVSQSLLVQSVSAVCLDYVPGVSSYVSRYIVCSAPCYVWIIKCHVSNLFGCSSQCSCVSSVRHPLNTLLVTSSSPRSWIPVCSTVTS